MMDEAALRERLAKITSDPDRRMILARLIDRWVDSMRYNSFTTSFIIGESNQALARTLFQKVADSRLHVWGGYEEASRVLVCFLPEYLDPALLPELCADELAMVRCSYTKQLELKHRDFLGSLIALGITRESIGDILVNNEAGSCDIIIKRSVLPLILLEYRQAGRAGLDVAEISANELSVPEQSFREIRGSVASLRLDAVLALACKLSRGDASDLITAGRVMVNGFSIDKADRQLSEGDTIACRGFGKFRLSEIGALSRKGRTIIQLSIYA